MLNHFILLGQIIILVTGTIVTFWNVINSKVEENKIGFHLSCYNVTILILILDIILQTYVELNLSYLNTDLSGYLIFNSIIISSCILLATRFLINTFNAILPHLDMKYYHQSIGIISLFLLGFYVAIIYLNRIDANITTEKIIVYLPRVLFVTEFLVLIIFTFRIFSRKRVNSNLKLIFPLMFIKVLAIQLLIISIDNRNTILSIIGISSCLLYFSLLSFKWQSSEKTDLGSAQNGLEGAIAKVSLKYTLTERESDIVNQIYQGFPNNEIADRLNISPHTVKNHISNIYNKLCIKSRIELVKIIFDNE